MAACSNFKKVSHVIFDLDGLLLDTEVKIEKIITQIAAEYGKEYTFEVRQHLLGSTDKNTSETVVRELQLPITPEEFLTKFKKLMRENLINVPLMKGAKRLICHLNCHRIPFAMGTSSSEEMVVLKTAIHKELFQLFSHRVCGSSDPEVKQGKPAPDIFLLAAARFRDKPAPAQCLVFEDAPNGVRAANAAGMQVVMVPDARVSSEHRALATQVLQSLEDFKPEQFGLPPFAKC